MPGDMLLGLPSNGLHTNGYSLARKLLLEVAGYTPTDAASGLELHGGRRTAQSASQATFRPIRALLDVSLSGAAHITGGGISDNMPRILPKGGRGGPQRELACAAHFRAAAQIGNVPLTTISAAHLTWGSGMILVVSKRNLTKAAEFWIGWMRSITRSERLWSRSARA